MARQQGQGVSFRKLLLGAALTLGAAACTPVEDGVDGGSGDSCGSRGQGPCERGEYCNFSEAAACGSFDAPGSCEPIPQVCTKEYAPVCGCDGQTYGNGCMAAAAGVSVQYAGECRQGPDAGAPDASDSDAGAVSCGGLIGGGCKAGEFCDYPVGAQCGAADQTGVCRATPDVCPQVHDPVCGCDGQTYGNACMAASASVSVVAQGACQREDAGNGGVGSFCGGFAGVQCPAELYCSYPAHTNCGSGDQSGTCQRKPEACTLQYDPVCGCDGKTYGNACAAAGAGVSVARDGAC